ncbi:ferredoxin [Virgisporangium aliadipatigenens]|uniref:Ferredoxin n=1 Tax=Virgisporangium aliadipatigenens TaxID=741659 RepID=A0A8J3YLV8_9ACTN|nr:PDR/VanB family oxidoreductase [Virgisporangium aliadipatigenens]GIJ46275.1 ferredoxin [Virgisporangium aliadipatigenens]
MNVPEFDAVVVARRPAAEGVVALDLARPDGGPLPPWEPGAHVDLVLRPELVRQYSLCGDPADARTWRIAVLREPAGRGGSAHVHDALPENARVRLRGPRNRFPLVAAERYLFVAGGIGITPILPMLAAADASGADWRLVYGGRTRRSMAFLDGLAHYGERVHVRPQDEYGLLDLDGLFDRLPPRTRVYCCGPEPLLAAVEQRVPPQALHVERFSGGSTDAADAAFEVVLGAAGRTVTVPPGTSILRAIEDAGVSVLSSCREGTCGTCETGVLEGVPEHRDSVLTAAERAANDVMMICVSRCRGSRLVLEL